MTRRRRPTFNDDVRRRLQFEREARTQGLVFTGRYQGAPRRLVYKTTIEVPVYDDERHVTIAMPPTATAGVVPTVVIDGPVCLRHRFSGGGLCLWWGKDENERRWVPTDGLLALVNLTVDHAYCEERCRRGHPWPRPEAPTEHRGRCPSCAWRR